MIRRLLILLAATLACATGPVLAQTPSALNVMVFPGGANLPLWVAESRGLYAREGLAIAIRPTPNSVTLVRALMDGGMDVALSAFDNVVAYQEGQGEVALPTTPDLFTFMAFSRGTVRLVVNPEIRTIADLRGRTLGVDAIATGYSMVLVKLLQRGGLNPGDYQLESVGGTLQRATGLMENRFAGTILTTPLELQPEARGYRRLANAVDELGPYQTIVGVARRSWAQANRARLVGFIRASVEALDWTAEAGNRSDAVAIYMQNIPAAPRPVAEQAVAALTGPREGFSPRGRLEADAMRTVLAIRSEFGRPQRNLADPAPYIDESYYAAATTR